MVFLVIDEKHAQSYIDTFNKCHRVDDYELLFHRSTTMQHLKSIQEVIASSFSWKMLKIVVVDKDDQFTMQKVRTRLGECKNYLRTYYENELLSSYVTTTKATNKLKDVTL